MNAILIENVRLVHPGERTESGNLLVRDGRIERIGGPHAPADVERVQGGERLLTPGLVDIHVHGVHTYNYDRGPDDVFAAAEVLGRYGTTCIVPTVLSNRSPDLPARLERLASAITKVEKVRIPGIHLEGPFVTVPGAGCAPVDGDLVFLEEMLAACGRRVSVVSVAPDTKNIIPVIERLREYDIATFLTHTRATAEQTLAAIEAGARHATHFYNVFYPPPPRELGMWPVGAVEAVLADPRVTCDIICDGVHVDPILIRGALAAKGWAGVSLITDANIGAGLPAQRYDTPWGYPVDVAPDRGARIGDPNHPYYGALAGSALTMDAGIRNLMRWNFVSPEQTWAMGTRNPAQVIGLKNTGLLAQGAYADLVLWNADLTPAMTWVAGRCVYRS